MPRYEHVEKCQACGGTGLYIGMAERDGSAVVCVKCHGTGAFLVYPNMLRCRRCGTYWVADKPLNTDIKDVTCSNCYSDQVFMSSVKIQLFEERP